MVGMKSEVKKVYRRCVCEGSVNLSGVNIPAGKELARDFGYPLDKLPGIPEHYWNTFAGCGNPWSSVKVKPGSTILDLGCGAGIDTVVALESTDKESLVIGIDLVFEMVLAGNRLINKLYPDGSERAYFLNGEAERLPFRADTFDLVICNGVLSLVPDKKEAVHDIYRCLKKHGRLVICDLIRLCPLPDYFYENEEAWAWCISGALSKMEVMELFESVGFSTDEFTWGKSFHYVGRATVIASK